MTIVNILGFSGSLRQGSLNTRLLHIAREMMASTMTLEIFDLAPIPFYNEDVEKVGFPESVAAFRQKITEADALLVACPEYNYSVTGILKNAIDWASRPPNVLDGKPYAIMGAGGIAGTTRAQLHFRQIVTYLNMHPVNKPQVIITFARQKFDAEGNLQDENAVKSIGELMVNLESWTRRLIGR